VLALKKKPRKNPEFLSKVQNDDGVLIVLLHGKDVMGPLVSREKLRSETLSTTMKT
jgi:hypothetical protein